MKSERQESRTIRLTLGWYSSSMPLSGSSASTYDRRCASYVGTFSTNLRACSCTSPSECPTRYVGGTCTLDPPRARFGAPAPATSLLLLRLPRTDLLASPAAAVAAAATAATLSCGTAGAGPRSNLGHEAIFHCIQLASRTSMRRRRAASSCPLGGVFRIKAYARRSSASRSALMSRTAPSSADAPCDDASRPRPLPLDVEIVVAAPPDVVREMGW